MSKETEQSGKVQNCGRIVQNPQCITEHVQTHNQKTTVNRGMSNINNKTSGWSDFFLPPFIITEKWQRDEWQNNTTNNTYKMANHVR